MDIELNKFLEEQGYTDLIELNGELCGIMKFLFTTGLIVGLTRYGYRVRFCYEFTNEARVALERWDGVHYPPGNWIKAKGTDEYGQYIDELNPNVK